MKTILSTTLLLLLCTLASAQKIGFKGGINVSTIRNASSYQASFGSTANTKLGFHLGGYWTSTKDELSNFQIELVASMRGFKQGNVAVDLYYADLPMLLRYRFSKKSSAHLVVGIQPSYFIGGEARIKRGNSIFEETVRQNDFDLGLVLGSIFKISRYLKLHLRGSLGILDDQKTAQGLNFELSISN